MRLEEYATRPRFVGVEDDVYYLNRQEEGDFFVEAYGRRIYPRGSSGHVEAFARKLEPTCYDELTPYHVHERQRISLMYNGHLSCRGPRP